MGEFCTDLFFTADGLLPTDPPPPGFADGTTGGQVGNVLFRCTIHGRVAAHHDGAGVRQHQQPLLEAAASAGAVGIAVTAGHLMLMMVVLV